MKKIFLVALILGIGSMSFARIYIAWDVSGVCFSGNYDYDCFRPEEKLISDISFIPMAGFSNAIGWEFNTDNLEVPWHFGVGATCGLQLYGISLGAQFTASYLLKDFGKIRMEICGTIEAGDNVMIDFCGGGGEYLYCKNSLDVLFMGNSRKGLYGGLGLVNINTPYLSIYKGYGPRASSWSVIGLHAQIGLKI